MPGSPRTYATAGAYGSGTSPRRPGASGAHHHGDAESGIYVLNGRIRMYFGDGLAQSVDAETGDFIYVPPNTVHVEENLADAPAELIVARNAAEYMVFNVPDPREPA